MTEKHPSGVLKENDLGFDERLLETESVIKELYAEIEEKKENEDQRFVSDLAQLLLSIADISGNEVRKQEEWYFASGEKKLKRATNGMTHDPGTIHKAVDSLTSSQKQMHQLGVSHNKSTWISKDGEGDAVRHGCITPQFGLSIPGFGPIDRAYLESLTEPLPSLPQREGGERDEEGRYTAAMVEYVKARQEITARTLGVGRLRRAISTPEILEAYPQLKRFQVATD